MKQWLKKYWWLPVCILFSILLPVLVNFAFLKFHFETGAKLDNATWLGFWGSYLGGLLGSVAALIALFLTIRLQERYHFEEKESNRLSHLPAFKSSILPFSESRSKIFNLLHIQQNGSIEHNVLPFVGIDKSVENLFSGSKFIGLELKNIGTGPAFDIHLFINNIENNQNYEIIGNLGSGDSIPFAAAIPPNWSFNIIFAFKDVFGNRYTQTFRLNSNPDSDICTYTFTETSTPILINEVK